MTLKTCRACTAEFTPRYPAQVFCSRECSGKADSSVELNCKNCGKGVRIPRYRVKSFQFCSRKCAWGYKKVHDRTEKDCSHCGSRYSVVRRDGANAKYCSDKCYDESMKYRGSVELTCSVCRKIFRRSPSKIRADKAPCCSTSCRNILRRVDKPGRASAARSWMKDRGMINSCSRCAYDERPEILVVHHGDRNRRNNNLDNLVVLCPNCHAIEHYGGR